MLKVSCTADIGTQPIEFLPRKERFVSFQSRLDFLTFKDRATRDDPHDAWCANLPQSFFKSCHLFFIPR